MKLTDIQYDMAAAYAKGELDGKTLADFEATLKENKVLREEVMFQKSIGSALRLDMVEEATKQAKIDNLLEDKSEHPKFEVIQNNMRQARIDNANQQKRIRRWWTGLVAACLIGVVMFIDKPITNIQTRNLITSLPVLFKNPNPFEEVSVGNIEEHIQTAEEQYTKGELEAAVTTLDLIPDNKIPPHIQLAKGKIEAKLKNYQESKQFLLLATESEETIIKDEAHFTLGMVYLRLREKEEAKKQLAQISSESQKIEAKQMMKKYLWFYPDFETQK